MAKMRRVNHRGQPATILRRNRVFASGDEMATRCQGLQWVNRTHPNKPIPTVGRHPIAVGQHHTNGVFLAGHHFAKTHVQRRGLTVQLIPRDMAFFNAHHAKGFGAVNHSVKFGPCHHQFADHCVTIARRHGDFIGQLAREGYPE